MNRHVLITLPRLLASAAIALAIAGCERRDTGYDPHVDGIMPQRAYVDADSSGQPFILGDQTKRKLSTGGTANVSTPTPPISPTTPRETSNTSEPAATPMTPIPASAPAEPTVQPATPAAPLSAPTPPPPPG